ncbi:MAG: DUF72 domain-containing protein [Rhodospirillales bacterium]|nr:DUF72 domain-containing protein [Rhodospirillales bacterium]
MLYGCCGWTDRTLIDAGTFYPAAARTPAERLGHYARIFPLVEVDATYYALPAERNAELWVARTPPGFVFNIKSFGLFTQHAIDVARLPQAIRSVLPPQLGTKRRLYLRDLPRPVAELAWEMQASALRPLAAAGKLGCVLFQFPPWFTARRDNIDYLERLAGRAPWPIAVEFRGGGWMTDNYRAQTLSLLEKLGAAYVVPDEPQGFRSSTPPVIAATSRLAVVRFHGRNAQTYEKRGISAAERFRYLYSAEELQDWVGPIRSLAGGVETVHVLMNNCYGDYAVRNALQLAEMLAAAA